MLKSTILCYNKEVIHKNKRNHPQLAGCHNPRRNQFIQRNPLLIHIPSLTPSSHARFLQLSNRLQYGLQRLTTSASPANIKIYSNLQTEAFEKISYKHFVLKLVATTFKSSLQCITLLEKYLYVGKSILVELGFVV